MAFSLNLAALPDSTAGALAAYKPDVFSVLPQGVCFCISVHPPGPPQPHPPI